MKYNDLCFVEFPALSVFSQNCAFCAVPLLGALGAEGLCDEWTTRNV
jgi:hypothetical protein